MKISLISCETDPISNGLRSISSQLKKYYHETKLIFLPRIYESSYTKKILETVYRLTKDSDLVGFYCMSQSSKKTIQIIEYLKSKNENRSMICGGIYATLNPEECLKYVNLVCVGEGEGAIIDLLQAIEKNEDITKIRNLWVKKDGGIYRNDVRPLIENINKLPFEDYDFKNQYILIDNKIVNMAPKHMKYGSHNLSDGFFSVIKGKFVTIHTVRGCPYDCAYCCNYDLKRIYSNKGRYVRKRDIKNVISELMKFKKDLPGIEFVWFTDDDFFIRTKDEIECFSKLYKEKIGLPFMCYVAPPTLKEDKLKILISSGLKRVEMGVQTGSYTLNKQLYNRDISQDAIVKASRILNKYQYLTYTPEYQFLCANPFETKEDVLETIELIQKLPKPFFLRIFNIVFFPGSYMYRKAIKSKVIKSNNESCADFDYTNSVSHLNTKKMSKDVLYLNSLLNLMCGHCNGLRYGLIPRFLLKLLISNNSTVNCAKNSRLLIRLLDFSPYGITFWKLPYKIKTLYVTVRVLAYREIYLTFRKVILRLKRGV